MRLQFQCPTCHKHTKVTAEIKSLKGGVSILKLDCGHTTLKEHVAGSAEKAYDELVFADGRQLFKFQAETCRFIERADLSGLIAHEQGCGKTIIFQALISLRRAELLPTAIFCKSGLRRQWLHETLKCQGACKVQTINSSKEFPIPGFEIYILSLDMLRSLDASQFSHIKSICIDEVQLIKNHNSKRTQAVREFVRTTKAKVIGLSGTPIKNNPGEYFPILNILRPELFPNQASFLKNWCDYDDSYYGPKVNRLRSPREFKEFTKDFIIRFERAEVLPDLPSIWRTQRLIDMTDDLMKAYDDVVSEFSTFVTMKESEGKDVGFDSILAYLARMRHITGLAKIEACVDFVTDFLLSTDRKITIFVHHKDVHQILESRINQFLQDGGMNLCLSLKGDMNADQKHDVVTKFWNEPYRVLIASTLASSEGLNLQVCSDAVMLERQWNPANEEQAEARFPRPGSTADKINICYIVAVGTIDEYLSQMIEKKRMVNKETMTGQEQTHWKESDIIKQLSEIILSKQLKNWSIPH